MTGRRTARIRDRLERVQDDLRRERANERILDEQVAHLASEADDAETRHLVAETPLADSEYRRARTDHERHRRLLIETRERIARLLEERDELLERLLEETT